MTVATIETAPLPDRMAYAKALAEASIIPQAFQRRPADVLVAVEYGNALGIAPIVALSEINVINGTPSLSASLMAALAREAGHKVRVSGDAESATCTIVRKDDPGYEHTATWDRAKAEAAKLWGRGHWSKDPATMLKWRAISECVRLACSEVLGGLKYTPEEVRDFSGPATTVHQAEPPKPPTATEIMQVSPTSPPPPEETGEIEMITDAQQRKMRALMKDLGLGRDDMLALATEETGREVTTSKDLTKAETIGLITQLDLLLKERQAEPIDAEVVDPDGPMFEGEQ